MKRVEASWVLGSVLLALTIGSCGQSRPGGFNGTDGGGGGDTSPVADDATPGPTFADGSTEAAPTCTGLQCQAVDCAAMGKPQTSLTGTIRDPAGALPLYNIYVYVPNTKPDPIAPGNPTCTPCQAKASGSPILGTLTDADGKFTLQKSGTDA